MLGLKVSSTGKPRLLDLRVLQNQLELEYADEEADEANEHH